MKRQRGFTIVEVAVVVAIVGIMAVLTVATTRAMNSNATLGGTVFGLQVQLQGLRIKALAEQRDLVFVLVNGDGSGCASWKIAGCARSFVVADPDPAAWNLATFDPLKPGLNTAELVDSERLEKVLLAVAPAAAGIKGPAPFDNVETFNPVYNATCAAVRCVAFRFAANGEVSGEMVAPDVAAPGNAIVLMTDLEGKSGAADRKILLVGFPSGIVKTLPVTGVAATF